MNIKYYLEEKDIIGPEPSVFREVDLLRLTDYMCLSCCVCKKWKTYQNKKEVGLSHYESNFVFQDEVYKINNRYYIVPIMEEHDICRELFRTNPLPYDKD